jgi:hypothetical protein
MYDKLNDRDIADDPMWKIIRRQLIDAAKHSPQDRYEPPLVTTNNGVISIKIVHALSKQSAVIVFNEDMVYVNLKTKNPITKGLLSEPNRLVDTHGFERTKPLMKELFALMWQHLTEPNLDYVLSVPCPLEGLNVGVIKNIEEINSDEIRVNFDTLDTHKNMTKLFKCNLQNPKLHIHEYIVYGSNEDYILLTQKRANKFFGLVA